MKTATIERYLAGGTNTYWLSTYYRGRILNWVADRVSCYATAPDYGQESIEESKARAKRFGFTHVRFVGDWSKRTKPKGGKL